MRRESHKPTEEEQSRRKRGLYVYSRTYDYVPTGELTLKIEPSYGTGLRSTWRDTHHCAIEQRLGEVMVSLRQHVAWRKTERLKAKERQERLQLELQRRSDLRARVETERHAVGRLEEQAASWHRAEQSEPTSSPPSRVPAPRRRRSRLSGQNGLVPMRAGWTRYARRPLRFWTRRNGDPAYRDQATVTSMLCICPQAILQPDVRSRLPDQAACANIAGGAPRRPR